jgi:hypothetical protein
LLHELVARRDRTFRVVRVHMSDVSVVVGRAYDRAHHVEDTLDPFANRSDSDRAGA